MSIEKLKALLDGFDPASVLPELTPLLSGTEKLMRLLVLIGPAVLLVMGLVYLLLSPKEANYYLGYRCYFGMGSEEAWRYAQRIAGLVWTALGLVLGVVMFFVSAGFAGMPVMDMVWKAVRCGIWQAALIAASCIAINAACALTFDAKGNRRKVKV